MKSDALIQLAQKIQEADAILIGGGSGLSSAAGYEHYHWSSAMAQALEPFREYYGFQSPMAGFYHCYSSYEEQWGYYSHYIRFMHEAPTGRPYEDLRAIVQGKPCFVLTTNVDMQFDRVFKREQICSYQGSFGYCQCSQPCEDRLMPNRNMIAKLVQSMDGVRIPKEMVPRCKECGRVLAPWVRDDTFLEGSEWKASAERYLAFLRHWLLKQTDKKLLLLELGVGEMTPSIIKLPFWKLTEKNEHVFYACLNRAKSQAPEHLRGKSLYVQGDLAETLSELRDVLQAGKVEDGRRTATIQKEAPTEAK